MQSPAPDANLPECLKERKNWNRWGGDDQIGALNLIDSRKRVGAAQLVRDGKVISLARVWSQTPGPANLHPLLQVTSVSPKGDGAFVATDFLGMEYHGPAMTHVDALCHAWDTDGMWNGRDPSVHVSGKGSTWGAIENWAGGVFTRGVLFDVPTARGTEYVTAEQPITGPELDKYVRNAGLILEPGDALVIYGGRERYEELVKPWAARDILPSGQFAPPRPKPGLDVSCVTFIRDSDCSTLVWDMMDAVPFTVHRSLYAFGIALVDNALIEPLAQYCRSRGRQEFLLTFAPLRLTGATGSPVNPLAIL